MKVCPNCQTENADTTRFCTQCGNSLGDVLPSTTEHHIPPAAALPYQASQPSVPYQQPTAYPPIAQETNNKALWSLVMGIIGIFIFPVIFNVPAIILGYIAKNEISRSGGREAGRGMALAGIILGWVGLFLGIIWVVVAIVAATADAAIFAYVLV